LSPQFQPPADIPKVEPPPDDAPFPLPPMGTLIEFERISLALPHTIKEARDLINEVQHRKNYFVDLVDPEAKQKREAKKAEIDKIKEEKKKKAEEKKKKEEEKKRKKKTNSPKIIHNLCLKWNPPQRTIPRNQNPLP